MRIIIAASGEGKRWNNFRNAPKHLAIIDGATLLERCYKQFREFTDDIVIISNDKRYCIGDAKLESPLEGEWLDFGKIYSSNHIWSNQRTIIVFGDVYFTDDAVQKIVTNKDDYKFFMRKGPSKITRKGHREIFAIAFSGGINEKIKSNIEYLVNNKTTGPGAWRLYMHMHGLKESYKEDYFNNEGYIEIDDWTDDFDYPNDLINWEKMRLKLGAK